MAAGVLIWLFLPASKSLPDSGPGRARRLWVNASSREHYVMERSRESGEADLVRLARETDLTSVEEAWVFVKYAAGREVWHEVGYEETRHRCRFDERPVLLRLMQESGRIDELSFYHYQPTHWTRPDAYSSEVVSHHDLQLYLKLMRDMDADFSELLEASDFRVAVSSGIYIVKSSREQLGRYFTDEAVAREVDLRIEDIRRQAVRSRAGKPPYPFAQDNRNSFKELCSRWARDFSTVAYEIEFINQ